ncbi:hypothetical protein PALB_14440 [Pseudoalteromonas luteoviolacea B = ATCC 29581]|nr:hypothetical protein PALB_14440 [Pseudoalteromonas luteoviolacea B = ATCC 29581]
MNCSQSNLFRLLISILGLIDHCVLASALTDDILYSSMSSFDIQVKHAVELKTKNTMTLYAELENAEKKTSHSANKRFFKSSYLDSNRQRFRYAIRLPESYKATENYPLIIFLHGQVNRPEWKSHETWWFYPTKNPTFDYISIFPTAYKDVPWWSKTQVNNILNLINIVKLSYPVDTDRIFLVGISDGGTGSFYLNHFLNSIFAGTVSFIGHPLALLNPVLNIPHNLYEPNIVNSPFLVMNGINDRLYPATEIEPIINHLKAFSNNLEYVKVEGSHRLSTMQEAWPMAEAFMKEHSRLANLKQISWQIESSPAIQRNAWINAKFESTKLNQNTPSGLLPNGAITNWIKAHIVQNTINITVTHPIELRLLISPKLIEQPSKPIKIFINGTLKASLIVDQNIDTILEWAVLDKDPQLLYTGSVEILVNDL